MNIVIFPLHDWKKCQSMGFARRDTQIIHELMKQPIVKNILIVERPISTAIIAWSIFKQKDWLIGGGELQYSKISSKLWKVSEKIFVLDTIIFEPFTTLFLRKKWWPFIIKKSKTIKSVKQAIKYLNLKNIVLWLFTPISADVIGLFDENLVIFDAIDNWVEHEGMKAYRVSAKKGYEKIKMNADIMFCGSKSMETFLQGGNAKVYRIPNGVDFNFFKPDENNNNIPNDLEKIPQPRIGYTGMLDSRIDVDLIKFVADSLSNYSFVFVGPVYDSKYINGQLSNLSNIHFLGHKRYEEIPEYINSFDVCIIPHKVNKYTDGMNPLKLYEYLACGKPVVSTSIAGTELFQSVIKAVETKSSFVKAIQECLTENAEQVRRRLDSVREYSWESRIEQMISHL